MDRGRVKVAVVLVGCAAIMVAGGCASSPRAERVELCGDLRNMRPTVAELGAPAADTRVGTIRDNLQKSQVVVDQLEAWGHVPWRVRDPLWEAQVDYVERLAGIPDGETVTSAGLRIRGIAGKLALAYDATARSLGCGR
jgi:hypothetical protein